MVYSVPSVKLALKCNNQEDLQFILEGFQEIGREGLHAFAPRFMYL